MIEESELSFYPLYGKYEIFVAWRSNQTLYSQKSRKKSIIDR